jgi:hypothetical protein
MRHHVTGIALALALAVGLGGGDAKAEVPEGDVAKSADGVSPLAVGSRIPSVRVQDIDGKPVALDTALGSEHVALIFYRGGW